MQSQEEPTINTRRVFQGRLIDVRVDTVRMSNCRFTQREIVAVGNSVCVVPIDEKSNVILVRQYRKAVEKVLLEVPAGGIRVGENSEQAALRELQEETGYVADELELLSFFWTTPGFTTEGMSAYMATGLTPGCVNQDEDENIEVVMVPLQDVNEMMASGIIQDGKSIAALTLVLLRNRLNTVDKE